ncbi:biopolymer transporter ExbD [uncultured Tateyamaria sp.]|uniref:ExbD/TolR family protein n=1 Tax=uncultured Tateyamaria sp. TaxID=455651 RepID=UPI00260DD01F|nr:biopolymer transporter ExbD [uncultured Tateyamaria sp.]
MASKKTPLPERPRRYRFVLTPLADAMFQLLIFFMLSTSLTPYSLITLKTASGPAPDAEQAQTGGTDESQPPPPPGVDADITLWTINNGTVRTAGQDYDITQLAELADAIGSQTAAGSVVLIVGETARVQDVAQALEALEGANVAGVQITREGA